MIKTSQLQRKTDCEISKNYSPLDSLPSRLVTTGTLLLLHAHMHACMHTPSGIPSRQPTLQQASQTVTGDSDY